MELPRWDAEPGDEVRCLTRIDDWAAVLRDHPAIEVFSPDASRRMRELNGVALLDALDRFAREHWDFRGGRERNLASAPAFSTAQTNAVDSAAATLGLQGSPWPRRDHYDAILMTGGMVRAGIVKPRFARELLDAGIGVRDVVFLGGFRTFAGDELALAPRLGVHGDNEFDAMVTGIRCAFDLGEPDAVEHSAPVDSSHSGHNRDNAAWRVESWDWNGRTVRVVAAPSSDPLHRRANTVDTFRFWAGRAKQVSSVLIVTTPIYVPYQGAGAIEVLGLEYGMSVETVAVSGSAYDLGELSQQFLSHHRAQELRSAIHGMRSLRARLLARGFLD